MSEGRWRDLRTRVSSALVMVAVAAGAAMAGSVPFGLLIAVVTGVMTWELVHMIGEKIPRSAVVAGIVCAACVLLAVGLPGPWGWVGCVLGAVAIAGVCSKDHVIAGVYGFAVVLTGVGLAVFFDAAPHLVLFLIAVVVLTDIGGYFAGRMFGGPKFWPAISPKKTWSGIVAGWLAAAVFALVFHPAVAVVVIAVLMSFASQMGDIAESAIKRRSGVKDSSDLIPGHGGFLDRFDGIVGATVVLALAVLVFGLPFAADL